MEPEEFDRDRDSRPRSALAIFLQQEVPDEQKRLNFLDNRYVSEVCQYLDKNWIDLTYDVYWLWVDLPFKILECDIACVVKLRDTLSVQELYLKTLKFFYKESKYLDAVKWIGKDCFVFLPLNSYDYYNEHHLKTNF